MTDDNDRWKSLYGMDDSGWYAHPTTLPIGESKPKCECGITITMGKDDHPSLHSSWCPIYKPEQQ